MYWWPKAGWKNHGLCHDVGDEILFEPANGLPMSVRQVAAARQICSDCPVKRTCLVHSLLQPEPFGIWGGFTTPERKRMFRAAEQAINARANRVLRPTEVEQISQIVMWFDEGLLDEKVVMRR